MRWLAGIGAGICAAMALLATAYALNALDDWHALRVMTLNDIAALESDPGYPNRDANLKSAREQILATDRDLRDKGLVSVLVLAPTVVVFVLFWQRAVVAFGRGRLIALVAITAISLIAAVALVVVMLLAGAIRG
jgi:hypothetical protein